MKTPSDDLFRLIKSLTIQEKVYFKKVASQKQKRYDAIKLFDSINTMIEPDENKLKKKLSNKGLTKNLTKIKKYTYEAILDSLQDFHADVSVNTQLHNYLQRIEILFAKKLYDLARKLITKAESLAIENDCYPYLLIILEWKYIIMFYRSNLKEFNNYSNEEHLKKLKYIDTYKNILEYQRLNVEKQISLSHGENLDAKKINKLNKFLQTPLLKNASNALSNPAKNLHYRILGDVYWGLKDFEKSNYYSNQSIQLFEQKLSYQHPIIIAYIRTIAGSVYALLNTGKTKELLAIKNKAEQFIKSLPSKLQSNALYNAYMGIMCNYISYQLESFNIREALKCSEEVKTMMETYADEAIFLVFYYNFFLISFYECDYRKALYCINKILNIKKTEIRQDAFKAAKIVNIIVHYELGNEDMLPGLCKSTLNYLEKRGQFNKAEKLLLIFFSEIIVKKITKKQKIEAFSTFKKQLETILSNPAEQKKLYYFDFIAWTESKIEEKSFAQIMKNKLM